MAKKKANPQSCNTKTQDDDEKLQSLKSLNAMLLKETVERRQQVDSLTQVNTVLESELNRLQSELTEEAVKLEIEKRVLVVEMATDLNLIMEEKRVKEAEIGSLNRRLGALEAEISEHKFIFSRVSEDRDAIRAQLHERIQIERLNAEKMETEMDSILREKDSIERNLIQSNRIIDDLKMEMNKITKQKTVERDLQEKKNNELNELVHKLQQGKTQLVNRITELEKKCASSSDKEAKMSGEIDILVKQKHDIKVEIQRLTQEKNLVAKELDDALKNLRKQSLDITQLATEKTKIENKAETDVIKFKQQQEELKNTVTTLEKLIIVQTDKIKQLEFENSLYVAASDQATKERNNARANLDGEKQKVKHLTENISKMEKDMEDTQKKLSKMQKDTKKLVAEKKDLENTCAVLEKEILVVKNSLAKTQKEHNDTQGKLRLSEANTRKILKILKTTSSVCNSKEDGNMSSDQETDFGEEIKHHVTEVEAIKKAFKEKVSVADEMKKQLELLQLRVAKADKGKSFWTMVSFATTVLAAISLAYVARGGY